MHDATAYVEALQQEVERLRADLEIAQRAHACLERERDALEQLNQVGRAIAAELDHQRVAQTVIDAAIGLTGAELGALFYGAPGERIDSHMVYAVAGVPRDAFVRLALPRSTALLGPSFTGHVTVRVPDITLDPRYGKNYPHRGLPEGHPAVRSYLSVPVVSRTGATIGALLLGHSAADAFGEPAERNALQLAADAASAIDNAQLHGEAQRLIAALEKTNAELDQFAYAASHDLRAPLRGITNLASWIDEDLPASTPDTTKEHLRLLKGRAARMDKLISGLLELSRIGRQRQKAERVDVTELLHETIQALDPREQARVMMIGELPMLITERAALQQVFHHLIGNALLHAGRDDVVVRLSSIDRGDEVELVVADNGVGIAGEHHARVWQLFQTLRSRDVIETTGIGLAIVRKQVESHGGRAWIDPEVAAGTTLRFTWPRRMK